MFIDFASAVFIGKSPLPSRAVVVVRIPAADADRRAADGRVRRHAPFNRGGVNERLESTNRSGDKPA